MAKASLVRCRRLPIISQTKRRGKCALWLSALCDCVAKNDRHASPTRAGVPHSLLPLPVDTASQQASW